MLERHVGVYVSDGFAVEERSFSDGCVKTCVKDRSWTHWYPLPFIDYGEAGNVKPSQTEHALGPGCSQRALKALVWSNCRSIC